MGTTSDILALAASQLQDISNRRWTVAASLVPYFNLGLLEILRVDPTAYVNEVDITLVAGAFQNLPADTIELIDVVCNKDSTGARGKAVTEIKKDFLDSVYPDWLSFPADKVVQYAVIDPRDPYAFAVFPPQPASTDQFLVVKTVAPPTPITDGTSDFPYDDSYKSPMVDYIVYRVLSEETTVQGALAKAKVFYGSFIQGITQREVTSKQVQTGE